MSAETVQLGLLVSVANLFSPFLTKFQAEHTSIHLLFEELSQVLQLLLQQFVKSDALKDKTGAQLLSVLLENRPAEACEFGTQTSAVLKKLKADKNAGLALLHCDMIQFWNVPASICKKDCRCRTSSCSAFSAWSLRWEPIQTAFKW